MTRRRWLLSGLAGLLALAALLWPLAGHAWSPGAPATWVPVIGATAIAAYATGRVADGAADPVVRRVWRRVSLSLCLILLAVAADITAQTLDPSAQRAHPSLAAMILFSMSALITLWTLPRIPAGLRMLQEGRIKAGLDLTIVMLVVGMFGSYFILEHPAHMTADAGSRWAVLIIVMLALAAVAAYIKITLTGYGVLDPMALSLLAAGVGVGAIGAGVSVVWFGRPYLLVAEPTMAVAAWLFTVAGERQGGVLTAERAETAEPAGAAEAAGSAAATGPDRQGHERTAPASAVNRPFGLRRPFDVLPYVAMAAAAVLLVVATRTAGAGGLVVVVFAIVIGAAVVTRQIVAYRDNARLVVRLDASMQELIRQEKRFRAMVQYSSDIIMISDVTGRIHYISPSIEHVLGRPAGELQGRGIGRYVHPDDWTVLEEFLVPLLANPDRPVRLQLRCLHADGSWRWLDIVSVNRLDDPVVGGIVSNVRDITENRLFQERLTYQMEHDELTQLAGRTVLTDRVSEALAECGPEHTVTLAVFDLDDFKTINDRLGHMVGDALLVALAERLSENIEAGDLVGRLGGDEFALLMQGPPPVGADAQERIETVAAAMELPVHAAGHDLLVQVSAGFAEGAPGMDASELLRRADVAMYAVKEQGKSGVLCYDPSMDVRSVEYARLGAELQQAMTNGELHLVFQPVVTLPDRRVAAVEALLRWTHPVRGSIAPAEFIPVAEHNGQIVALGAWVLTEACSALASWRAQGLTAPVRMSVNVSARQLSEPYFAELVADVLAGTGLEPSDLVMEITETAVFDGGRALETVKAIHALGVRTALDDFGTGHSSLGLLRTCPVDVVKVDKLFVDVVTGTPQEAAIATSIVQIARAMDLCAVAEGVETAEQAARLYELGYPLAQGYLFSRPMSEQDVTGLLVDGIVPAGCGVRARATAPASPQTLIGGLSGADRPSG